ncbi:MAG TPA: hypothetical protein P5019_02925 [Syntrophales bacterium]|nr:hypothetical protein [Syntrophales bacterium]
MESTQERLYGALERAFTDTFISELIPGIIHNFANPLNGILGRGQIMKRRLDQLANGKKGTDAWEETIGRLRQDVVSINGETERLCDMFRDVADKFQGIVNNEADLIALGRLVAAELRLADHYLEFKHRIKKEVHIEEELPPVRGRYCFYSLALWGILRATAQAIREAGDKTLQVWTSREGDNVVLRLRHATGARNPYPDEDAEGAVLSGDTGRMALCLLRTLGAETDIADGDGYREWIIRIRP